MGEENVLIVETLRTCKVFFTPDMRVEIRYADEDGWGTTYNMERWKWELLVGAIKKKEGL